eukprot:95695_1
MAKSFIDVGVLLKQAPSDAVVNALTPDKDKTKRHITKKYEKERARLKAYLASKNTETLPAIQNRILPLLNWKTISTHIPVSDQGKWCRLNGD